MLWAMDLRYRNVTGFVLFAAFFGLVVWDVWLLVDGKDGNTISEVLGNVAAVGFLLSYLVGHFWPQTTVIALLWRKDLRSMTDSQLQALRKDIDDLIA